MALPTSPVALSHPHPEARTYPLMLRTWTYAWWKPVVGLVVLVIGFSILAPVVLSAVLAVGLAFDHEGSYRDAFAEAATLDHVTWPSMLGLNLALASLTLVTWAIVRYVHRMRPRWLASVTPGIRWGFFCACFGLAVVALLAQIAVGVFLPSDPNDFDGSVNEVNRGLIALGVVIVLSTPLQAIGEEYAFRGYAMQAFGSLTREPWVAIGLSAVLFAMAHGVQNAPLFLDRLTFGVMAGYVVYRTGGLEAGIAMHVWNNLVAFGFGLFLGDIDDMLNATEVSWWNIPLTVTQNGVYLVLVLLVARSMGLSNRSAPPVVPPSGSPVLVPTTPPV